MKPTKKTKLFTYFLYLVFISILIINVKIYAKNNSFSTNSVKEKIKVNIANSNDADSISYSKLQNGTKFCVYGPFQAGKNNYIKIRLKNDIKTRIIVATSGNNDIKSGDMLSNNAITDYTLNSYVSITSNENGKYYIFVGAENIKNLNGTLEICVKKNKSERTNKNKKDKSEKRENYDRIINNFATVEDMKNWFKNNVNSNQHGTIINNINEGYNNTTVSEVESWLKANENYYKNLNITIYLDGKKVK